jgi:hypothetical protein
MRRPERRRAAGPAPRLVRVGLVLAGLVLAGLGALFCGVLATAAPAAAPPSGAPPGASSAAPPAAGGAGPATPPAAPSIPFRIDGFRSADFGMTEREVRLAVRKDFSATERDISVTLNPDEKTAVLTIIVPDLVPSTGPARIAYIFGYRTRRLIQVNVLWSTANRGSTPESVVATGNLLRDYFLGEGAPSTGRIVDGELADGSIVVLRAADASGHMVLILLSGTKAKERRPMTLELSYILDPKNPDIYRLRRGQF